MLSVGESKPLGVNRRAPRWCQLIRAARSCAILLLVAEADESNAGIICCVLIGYQQVMFGAGELDGRLGPPQRRVKLMPNELCIRHRAVQSKARLWGGEPLGEGGRSFHRPRRRGRQAPGQQRTRAEYSRHCTLARSV